MKRVALSVLAVSVSGCPGPGPEPIGVFQETCLLSNCHGAVEQIHYGAALTCVDCHGGDNTDVTKKGAHVTVDVSFNPSTPGNQFMDDPTGFALDQLDPEIIQFLNPSDYRVASQTCGTAASGAATCHPSIVENSKLLTRATLAGQLAGGGFVGGSQDKVARFGVRDIADPHTPGELPEGYLSELQGLPESAPDGSDPIAEAYFPIFEQLCLECHLNRDGPHVPGRYYSSGCNGCHMITTNGARAETGDITQDLGEIGHVQTHRFTNLIPDTQCAHCHMSHLSRSMLAQGIRERSEPEGDEHFHEGPNRGVEDPDDAVFWPEEFYVRHNGQPELYGKPFPFYIEDEHSEIEGDETPADVHTAAGLACIDCHNIREAHGDGQMAGRMDQELDVRCESCHGRPGDLATLHSEDGLPFDIAHTSVGGRGNNENVFSKDDAGKDLQYGRFTKLNHPVTQIHERTDLNDPDFNLNTQMGCELHAGSAEKRAAVKARVNALAASDPTAVPDEFPGLTEGFTFAQVVDEIDGRVECFACHNTWTLNCYGCHMVRDDSQFYVSETGEEKRGKAYSFGMSVVADELSMGFNAKGKISPMVGTQLFFSHVDEDGELLIDAVALPDFSGTRGAGNVHNPVHHHTVQRVPRNCDGCHPSATGSHDEAKLLTAVGLGSGRFTFEDGEGTLHLLDQLVTADFDGDGVIDDPTAGLPARVESATPVVSTTHQPIGPMANPPPGALDADTINLVLESVIVPQNRE